MNGLLTYDRSFKLPLELYQEFSKQVYAAAQKCWAVAWKNLRTSVLFARPLHMKHEMCLVAPVPFLGSVDRFQQAG